MFSTGVVVHDDFLSRTRVHDLKNCAETRRSRGDFGAANIGADRARQRRAEIRGDFTCWLEEPLFEEERELLRDLERLRLELNRDGMLGLFDLELHYAWYPPGAGYARHVDQLLGRAERIVSFILYLNDAWTSPAGGQLRVFDEAYGYRDIEPVAGRLVLFVTAGREHAVLPTAHGRWSVAGWFRRRS